MSFGRIGYRLSILDAALIATAAGSVMTCGWFNHAEEPVIETAFPSFNLSPLNTLRETQEQQELEKKKKAKKRGLSKGNGPALRVRLNRIYPDAEQREILRNWFGCARVVYNRTVAFLKDSKEKLGWKEARKLIIHNLPEWHKKTPWQIKAMALKEAFDAVMQAKLDYGKDGKLRVVKFRSKRDREESIYIPKQAFRSDGRVYEQSIKKSLNPREDLPKEFAYDGKLRCERGTWWLSIPEPMQPKKPENQRLPVVALDPGVRTFMTYWCPQVRGKIGSKDFSKIYRLCYELDDVMSRSMMLKKDTSLDASTRHRKRRNMRNAMDRIRRKIQNLVEDLHWKVASWLCSNFDSIVLPPFNAHDMVTKLRSKTARAMLTWSHGLFRLRLKSKAEEWGCRVILQEESYTSKTCGSCWRVQEIGSKEEWTCLACGCKHDRDFNGARNELLKSLGVAPIRSFGAGT